MTGEYQHSIDAKGRIFIPAKLRDELGDTFFVTISMERCLTAYSEGSWSAITEKFDALPLSQSRKMRPLFANAARCETDGQGRILLPAKLREYAGLRKNITVVGVSKRAEIWDTDAWNSLQEDEMNPDNIAAAMEELGF